jgi:peptidoglycan/LPS O-acetylase OafA/YrhL
MPRLVGLDRLRGIALLLMLVQHLTEWLYGDARQVLPGWEGFAVTDVCAPAFTVAAGASGLLLVTALERKGRPGIDATVLRRYGLLVPIGFLLQWALWQNALSNWNVLEMLGVTVVLSTLVARRVSTVTIALLAAAALSIGPMVAERVHSDDLIGHVLGPGFPLVTYLGLALVGAVAARLALLHGERVRLPLLLGLGLTVAVGVAVAAGRVPHRHPGTIVEFVLPGLAGTVLLYGLVAGRLPGLVDAVVRPASRHAFGIFLGHYAVYALLRATGALHQVPAAASLTLAVVGAVAIAVVSPYAPVLPWTPRVGARRPAPA